VQEDKDPHWVFDIKDQHIVYDLICRRLLFHSEYYQTPRVSVAEFMLVELFVEFYHEAPELFSCTRLKTPRDIEQYLELNDKILLSPLDSGTYSETLRTRIRHLFTNPEERYKYIGDYFKEPEAQTDEIHFPYKVYVDKSTPLNVLPKVRYHSQGALQPAGGSSALYRVIKRSTPDHSPERITHDSPNPHPHTPE